MRSRRGVCLHRCDSGGTGFQERGAPDTCCLPVSCRNGEPRRVRHHGPPRQTDRDSFHSKGRQGLLSALVVVAPTTRASCCITVRASFTTILIVVRHRPTSSGNRRLWTCLMAAAHVRSGKAIGSGVMALLTPVHPHMRGEGDVGSGAATDSDGSPPHAWGRHQPTQPGRA